MIWITHTIFAALLFLLLKYPINLPWLALPVCLLAALLPDIDHHNSKITNKLGFVGRLTSMLFDTRGIVHSFIGALAFFTLVYVAVANLGLNMGYAYAFGIGYVSHLFLDSLNPMGIAWLNPFSKTRLSGKIRTGGYAEVAILIVIGGLTIVNIVKLIV